MFTVSLFIFIVWIILNAKITLEIIVFGLGILALVWSLLYILLPNSFHFRFSLMDLPGIIRYLWILVMEVIKANIDMIKIVLFVDEKDLRPAVTRIDCHLNSKLAITALTSSITLTPGTITVAVNQDELYIHALDISMLEGIDDSIFVKKLKELEGQDG